MFLNCISTVALALPQIYTNKGVTARGRAAIAARLQSVAELHEAFGGGTHRVDDIDSSLVQARACAAMCMQHAGIACPCLLPEHRTASASVSSEPDVLCTRAWCEFWVRDMGKHHACLLLADMHLCVFL